MSDTVIHTENIGKRYRLGRRQQNAQYGTLREDLKALVTRPLERLRRKSDNGSRPAKDDFIWALQDVSFDIKQGDVVGIIGRNGAGKSTLLKIFSRITEPTKGRAEIHGRVGSLLEVGTGFHPELTGRENIFLNGAILGMTRRDIIKKFDAIVDFAEIDKFIDTPAKFYSSGMYMRLAFAVAAHMEPEILVVDEVLAVGDAEFQKKCLGKMQDVSGEGRTVLFVSHSMSAIQRLCQRGIVLDGGRVVLDGSVDQAVEYYLGHSLHQQSERIWPDIEEAPGNDTVRLKAIRLKGVNDDLRSEFDVRDSIVLEIEYNVLAPSPTCIALEFLNAAGTNLMVSFDNYIETAWRHLQPRSPGTYRAQCRIPGDLLTEGQVSVNLRIFSPPLQPNEAPHVRMFDAIRFDVIDLMDPSGVRGHYPHSWGAPAVRPRLAWTTDAIGS